MIVVFCMQHVILAGKLLLASAIPDLPEWVTEEKARLEFQQREALKVAQQAAYYSIYNLIECLKLPTSTNVRTIKTLFYEHPRACILINTLSQDLSNAVI